MNTQNDRLFDFGTFFSERPRFDFVNLVQVGEVALIPGGRIEGHKQVCHEISYIVSGSGVFYTNGEGYSVAPGDVHVIAAGDLHKIEASPTEKLRYICIGFTLSDVPEAYRSVCDFYKVSPPLLSGCENGIRSLFDMLIGEFYVVEEDRERAIAELLKLILTKVRRAFVTDSLKRRYPERGVGRASIVYRIAKYIDDHVYAVRTVGEIARALHYSESYLSTVFRQKMGVTLQTYLREKKLETAKMLLEQGNLTVGEVSELMHFDCVQSFSKNFKKFYGTTPYRYLEKYKTETQAT